MDSHFRGNDKGRIDPDFSGITLVKQGFIGQAEKETGMTLNFY